MKLTKKQQAAYRVTMNELKTDRGARALEAFKAYCRAFTVNETGRECPECSYQEAVTTMIKAWSQTVRYAGKRRALILFWVWDARNAVHLDCDPDGGASYFEKNGTLVI